MSLNASVCPVRINKAEYNAVSLITCAMLNSYPKEHKSRILLLSHSFDLYKQLVLNGGWPLHKNKAYKKPFWTIFYPSPPLSLPPFSTPVPLPKLCFCYCVVLSPDPGGIPLLVFIPTRLTG